MSSPAFRSPPSETSTLDALRELALDLRWSFNHSADKLWERLDPDLWDLTHNPWIVLQTVSEEKLQSVSTDPDFQLLVADLHREKQAVEQSQGWFQKAHPRSGLTAVAYFSMEFMLSEALPIGRTWQRRWRPTQSVKQSQRSGEGNRPALPAGIFSPGNRRARTTSGAVSLQRPWSTADQSRAQAES